MALPHYLCVCACAGRGQHILQGGLVYLSENSAKKDSCHRLQNLKGLLLLCVEYSQESGGWQPECNTNCSYQFLAACPLCSKPFMCISFMSHDKSGTLICPILQARKLRDT
jgi:hypothetical protein